jgi:uncharacterized protein (TIRG00374 family)
MNKLLRPSVVIPLTLSAAVLAALLGFSHPAQVVAVMEGFQPIYLLYVLVLMVAYETLRWAQWSVLLAALRIRIPLRTQVFTFLGGEVAESLPVGTYFRNYLLHGSTGTDFGLSSAATTLSMVTEVAVCLAGLLILGLGAWSSWLRPVIVIGLALFLFLVWAVHRSGYALAARAWLRQRTSFRRLAEALRGFRMGAGALLHPRVLAVQSLLGALYVIVAGAVLYLVVRGLGIGHVSLWEALALYFFGLGFTLISPIPLDIGVLEVSGVGALLAVGMSEPDAVGVMLLNRALRTATPLAIALVVVVILRDEVRAAVRERSG